VSTFSFCLFFLFNIRCSVCHGVGYKTVGLRCLIWLEGSCERAITDLKCLSELSPKYLLMEPNELQTGFWIIAQCVYKSACVCFCVCSGQMQSPKAAVRQQALTPTSTRWTIPASEPVWSSTIRTSTVAQVTTAAHTHTHTHSSVTSVFLCIFFYSSSTLIWCHCSLLERYK